MKKVKKESGSDLKTMSMNKAGRIVEKAHKEQGESWGDYWNPIDEDLFFVASSLEVIGEYALQKDEACLCPLIDDLGARVDRVREKLDEVVKRLAEKHRLGPHLPRGKEDNDIFTLPKIVLEKYKLV